MRLLLSPNTITRTSVLFILLSLGLSHTLYFGEPFFIPLPAINNLYAPEWLALSNVAIFLICLLLILFQPQRVIYKLVALAAYLTLVLYDLNRLQPELLFYFLILFLSPKSITNYEFSLKVALALLYFGTSVSKFNGEFVRLLTPWFFSPYVELPPGTSVVTFIGSLIPVTFLILTVLYFISEFTKNLSSVILIIIHLFIIFTLAVLHQSYLGLSLFNLFLIFLHVYFINRPKPKHAEIEYSTLYPLMIASTFFIASILSFIHPYYSFQIFSNIPVKTMIAVSDAFFTKLPEELKTSTYTLEGESFIDFPLTYTTQIGFPAFPSANNYMNNASMFASLATSSDDMVFLIQLGDKGGLGNGLHGFTVSEIQQGEFSIE